ncbi:M20 family metallo-hydrolase [Pedobacter cryoconitis]|uniref:Acetylornithine deacetylase n=1 Tax=Pedobacter cryoconitis TaxID=188932 RepID=A0A7X0MJ23_9SPHI|nr:M20 family metallo-hydrolase [Pedobacter cryoconitis]MBB6500734.1 acetylornithine deacetylase [Pedobacter cryoconitis]
MKLDFEHQTDQDSLLPHQQESIELLKQLISKPSFSGQEEMTANLIESFLQDHYVFTLRKHNNIWCYNLHFDHKKPTILLNSHHDTVRPSAVYTKNPFEAIVQNDKLFGLGSNDAGGALVSLIATFLHFFKRRDLPFNICLAATAEEETSGEKGLKSILDDLLPISFAIVGEPTNMQMAIAEKGSMVLDCKAFGRSGHAAREEGDNAIYRALKDIQWFSSYVFPIESRVMGPVKMTVTEVNAGIQHNIVPAECNFTVDVRLTDAYTEKELLHIIQNHTFCEFTVRPGVLKPSCINQLHPIVKTGLSIGRSAYISPTSSDQGWLDMPSVKMGPGESARSHTADEFIYLEEIKEGMDIYVQLLESLFPYLMNNPEPEK